MLDLKTGLVILSEPLLRLKSLEAGLLILGQTQILLSQNQKQLVAFMTVSAAIWILSKNNQIASTLYTLFAPSLCHVIGHALRKKKSFDVDIVVKNKLNVV